jgi:hypothetical protein
MTADLNVFQNAEKSVCAKAFEENNRMKTPINQVCLRSTRLCSATARRAQRETNEFISGTLTVLLIKVFSFG